MEAQPYVLAPRSPAAVVEDQFIRLFKRCLQCPPTTPSCACAAGQTCSLVSATCNQCQFTTCSGTPTNSSVPVAAIVGGVVGGVFILAVIVFLALRFRKHRQQEYPAEEEYDEEDLAQMQMEQEKEEQEKFAAMRSNRMSARTVASTASSAVSGRTSNIIQIAYIPGVTNRSQSQSELAPPMPPIPAASGATSRASPGSSNRTSTADQFMFHASDFRDSTYSGYSARSSVAASRASFASTAYRNDAIINPMPATAVNLLKPTSVSVKGSAKGSPSISRSSSPPVGSSSPGQQLHTKSSIVGTFAQPRTITVTRKPSNSIKPHGIKAFELDGSDHSISSATASMHQRSGPASPRSNTTFEYAGSDEDDVHSMSSHLVELPAHRSTMLPVIPPVNLGPAELSESSRHSSIPRAIQDSMMKAMQINMGPAPGPDASPFSDAHESRTP